MNKSIAFSVLVVLALILTYSCKREYNRRYCDSPPAILCFSDSTLVNVRISNKTKYPLCNVSVKFQTDTTGQYYYGTMDKEETSCYTAMERALVFPRIKFQLGEFSYIIQDSLRADTLPYSHMYHSFPSYVTYHIFISDSTRSSRTYSILLIDKI